MDQKQKMLLGIGIVAGLCLCAGLVAVLVLREAGSRVSESFKMDPTSIAEVGNRIAEYDVPPGYDERMAISLFTYDMLYIMPSVEASQAPMIVMMQFTGAEGTDPAQMQEAMEQQTGQPGSEMDTVETRTEIIRGEKVVVTISESTSQGITLRQWMAVFQGNGGPTILMIQGSTHGWDEQLITDFIHSIR